jgi:hypothetical protein
MVNALNSDRGRASELREALEGVLARQVDGGGGIRRWRHRMWAYSSSWTLENIEAELEDGGTVRLVLKDLSPGSLLSTARRVRPAFLYEPMREIELYRLVLRNRGLGTPRYYGSLVVPERSRYWLFLERVRGPLLWQLGRLESWRQAARWLARLHGQFRLDRNGDVEGCGAPLLRYDREWFGVWMRRAEGFLGRAGGGVEAGVLRRFGRLADNYAEVVERLVRFPVTLIHGEFSPSNILWRRGADPCKVCPVDWEVAAMGPGVVDVAALTSGDWSEDSRRSMVRAYGEAQEPGSGVVWGGEELFEAVELSRLHIAVQMLGWSGDWSPPPGHARDWLGDAVRLAENLGVIR